MSDIERPAKKSKTAAPRRDIRIRPLPIDPNLPEWQQVRLQAWSARRALRVLRRLRRADPNIPADRIVELQLKAIELEVRIKALAVRYPPPSRSATAISDAPPPAREISQRDEIRRSQPETRTGPPRRKQRLWQEALQSAAKAACRSSGSTLRQIDRNGPSGKRADSGASVRPIRHGRSGLSHRLAAPYPQNIAYRQEGRPGATPGPSIRTMLGG
jgi:hypothetical protein